MQKKRPHRRFSYFSHAFRKSHVKKPNSSPLELLFRLHNTYYVKNRCKFYLAVTPPSGFPYFPTVKAIRFLTETSHLKKAASPPASQIAFAVPSPVSRRSVTTTLAPSSIQEVASGTVTQAQSAEENAKAMDEMAVGIQRIAEAFFNVAESSANISAAASAAEEQLASTQMIAASVQT